MSETPFFKTRMGHQFYERTVPALVKQLERIGDLLQALLSRSVKLKVEIGENRTGVSESCHETE